MDGVLVTTAVIVCFGPAISLAIVLGNHMRIQRNQRCYKDHAWRRIHQVDRKLSRSYLSETTR